MLTTSKIKPQIDWNPDDISGMYPHNFEFITGSWRHSDDTSIESIPLHLDLNTEHSTFITTPNVEANLLLQAGKASIELREDGSIYINGNKTDCDIQVVNGLRDFISGHTTTDKIEEQAQTIATLREELKLYKQNSVQLTHNNATGSVIESSQNYDNAMSVLGK